MEGENPIGRGLYLHLPFCSGKCGYCAFYSQVAPSVGTIERYLDRLDEELALRWDVLGGGGVATVYMGGGTPSILSQEQFARLAGMVNQRLGKGGAAEWSVEINPGDVDAAWIGALRDLGVTRVSLGVQALDDGVLEALGRRHTVADVRRTLNLLRAAGVPSIGMDLICALPGVDDTMWAETLESMVALGPDHLSVYALSIEPGSSFHARVQAGETLEADEALICTRLDRARDFLGRHGYAQEETSNFARPGHACQHNLNVWRGGDYLGVGCAASSRIGLDRWTNDADLAAYLAASDVLNIPRQRETLTPEVDAGERLMFAFRLSEGVDLAAFAARCGPVGDALLPHWRAALQVLASEGLVVREAPRWYTTERGRHFADYIAMEMLGGGS